MASQSPKSPTTPKANPGVTCSLSKPQVPPGEDKASFDRHNNALVIEFRKSVPNMTVVNSLMDASFAMRWADIHDNPCPVDIILEKYPFLKIPTQVSNNIIFILFYYFFS